MTILLVGGGEMMEPKLPHFIVFDEASGIPGRLWYVGFDKGQTVHHMPWHSGHLLEDFFAPRRKRPSRGYRRHVRRMKQQQRRAK